jgi:hypothetical protein
MSSSHASRTSPPRQVVLSPFLSSPSLYSPRSSIVLNSGTWIIIHIPLFILE